MSKHSIIHTKNDDYILHYRKGYTANGNAWHPTLWYLIGYDGEIAWKHKGKLFNKQKKELLDKFNFVVVTN